MSTIVSEPPVAQTPEKATLRRQLLLSLLAPIVLVTLISSVVSYYYAFNFATLAYDYSLFDSALDMLESDAHDRTYYQINDAKGAFVAGHRGLPLPGERAPPGKPVYYDGSYGGSPVRIAALYTMGPGASDPGPVLIQ